MKNLIGVDIACHHQNHIVWCIPVSVPLLNIRKGEVLKIIHPADDGIANGAGLKRHRGKRFEGKAGGIVVGAKASLLHDHLNFFFKFLVVELQKTLTIGLQAHHFA